MFLLLLRGSIFILLILISGCDFKQNIEQTKGRYSIAECKKSTNIFSKNIDRVIVDKSKREMICYSGDDEVYKFKISLSKVKGKKIKSGDHKVPEGIYKITRRRCHRKYYKMINISYPNRRDREEAKNRGVKVGGGITVHGQLFWNSNGDGDDYTLSKDWTNGCIALRNSDLDKFWSSVKRGTTIEIKP